jgi:hypothetical protein
MVAVKHHRAEVEAEAFACPPHTPLNERHQFVPAVVVKHAPYGAEEDFVLVCHLDHSVSGAHRDRVCILFGDELLNIVANPVGELFKLIHLPGRD